DLDPQRGGILIFDSSASLARFRRMSRTAKMATATRTMAMPIPATTRAESPPPGGGGGATIRKFTVVVCPPATMTPVCVCCTYELLVARTEYVPSATDALYWPDAFVDVATTLVLPLRTVIPIEASGEPSAS